MKFNIKKIVLFSIILFCISLKSFSQVLNPVFGTWANKQSLVINLLPTQIAFYSFNDQNPESSGFAYDGPVLLDVEGNVKLNVVIINEDEKKDFYVVNYSVKEQNLPNDEDSYKFLSKIKNSSIYEYSSGDVLSIPQKLLYTFEDNLENFEDGKNISLSKNSVLTRFLPCTFSDGTFFWRTVIKISPSVSGTFSRKDIPLKIKDWSEVSFTSSKLLYKIDDEYWQQIKKPVNLSRTESHMVSWQDLDFNAENPVNFFVLPEKPNIDVKKDSRGVLTLSFEDGTPEGYKFGILNEDGNATELFKTICVDTFEGSSFKGTLQVGIFYDSVFQGKETYDFNIYKKSPNKPKFVSSAQNNFSREAVKVQINSENAKEVFYKIAGPIELNENETSLDQNVLLNLQSSEYKKYSLPIVLDSSSEKSCLFKVFAYSVDFYDQKSSVSEYSVILDKCNFCINPLSTSENATGSVSSPFKTFEECLPFINQSSYANVKIIGEVQISQKNLVLSTNCKFYGNENSKLIFAPDTNLSVLNSSLVLENLFVEHRGFEKNQESAFAFNVNYGVLVFENCEVLLPFNKNGMAIKAEKSVLKINNSGITVTSSDYNSVCASVDSKIYIKNSKISGISNTSVLFSCQGGLFESTGSTFKITSDLGRIAELFDCDGAIKNNIFVGELSNPQKKIKPIYISSKNNSLVQENNSESGF